jgi:hypothetical protein
MAPASKILARVDLIERKRGETQSSEDKEDKEGWCDQYRPHPSSLPELPDLFVPLTPSE